MDTQSADAVIDTATLPLVGTTSDRFLSYNVEMVELTGGRFWKPYRGGVADKDDQYEYRPPIDLSHPRIRKLAAALGPAYVRYSGTWANATVYLDEEAHTGPAPEGFDAVLTKAQWRGAIEFAKEVDAGIVVSMPTSAGTRDADGVWQSGVAERWMQATDELGGVIAATEFANEPNLISGTQPPADYAAADYRRDYDRFHAWMKARSPDTRIMAPGAFEFGGGRELPAFIRTLPAQDLVPGGETRPDVVSFHFYGEISKRCSGVTPDPRGPEWLSRIDGAIANTMRLRDALAPGAPVWLSETAETACGGNPQAATFADSFRFADQLASAAKQGVSVVMHNTLAASDYALLDEDTFAPRPNYWTAYLWRQTMGSRVLGAAILGAEDGLRLYAHCQRGVPGGVTLLALNLDGTDRKVLRIDGPAQVYSLTGKDDTKATYLNGQALSLGPDDEWPEIHGESVEGPVRLAAASISFITLPDAANPACR
ncbi:hypothetical protein [Croceicoccus gelatinilyticus]|uniref:hypothetical protein n=1 Tax=Croceicoccus gelatinilyticus TaxID=2835536 RepID=UPI001BCF939C|nr:hypothetical protein [Croceicoccus gelatinilyticus]MBS7671175.1 hypothetical protein [Croceicoccus gelatinilyticus]